MTARTFGFENGQVVTNRPAEYQIELLGNGYARVDHRPSGLVTLIDPATSQKHSGSGSGDWTGIRAEIQRRWGGAR